MITSNLFVLFVINFIAVIEYLDIAVSWMYHASSETLKIFWKFCEELEFNKYSHRHTIRRPRLIGKTRV